MRPMDPMGPVGPMVPMGAMGHGIHGSHRAHGPMGSMRLMGPMGAMGPMGPMGCMGPMVLMGPMGPMAREATLRSRATIDELPKKPPREIYRLNTSACLGIRYATTAKQQSTTKVFVYPLVDLIKQMVSCSISSGCGLLSRSRHRFNSQTQRPDQTAIAQKI